MAKMFEGIKIEFEKRPCYVEGKKAIFHYWTQDKETFGDYYREGSFGIVEFEDGHVELVIPNKIVFADGGEFSNIAFKPLECKECETSQFMPYAEAIKAVWCGKKVKRAIWETTKPEIKYLAERYNAICQYCNCGECCGFYVFTEEDENAADWCFVE